LIRDSSDNSEPRYIEFQSKVGFERAFTLRVGFDVVFHGLSDLWLIAFGFDSG